MNCLKCGREISEDQVFCEECRLDAQRYPVNPAAAVFLPKRKAPDAPKKVSRRRNLPLEEQLKLMRRRFRAALIAAILAAGIALALAYPAAAYLKEEHYQKGQNYRPIIPVSSPTEGAATSGK